MKTFRRHLLAISAAALLPAAVLAQNIVLKSHDTHPAGYPTVVAIESMGKKLDAATQGRIKIQTFPGAVLGQEKRGRGANPARRDSNCAYLAGRDGPGGQ